MRVAFTTVLRMAPPEQGGDLVLLDWDSKKVLATRPIRPEDPAVTHDPNPRGNARGGRGIIVVGDRLLVASYHSLLWFDFELAYQGRITDDLFCGLHEMCPGDDGSVWVAATAIDAALQLSLADGKRMTAVFPREVPSFQSELDVTPKQIDKTIDNRLLYLGREHLDEPGHLHLNAVRLIDGELHALFNHKGVVANLDQGRVVLRDSGIDRGHNLVVGPDGLRYVCDTPTATIRIYNPDWSVHSALPLRESPTVRQIVRDVERAQRRRRLADRLRRRPEASASPLFLRGLALVDDRHALVGISPATLLLVDLRSGEVEDFFAFDDDVRAAIHGISLLPAA